MFLSDIFEDAIGSDKTKTDTDGDGYNDYVEIQNGFSSTGPGAPAIDNSLVSRLKGKILLQVQQNGEAWYLSPVDSKRYFLGRPHDAFTIMRNLGLGITDADLSQIGKGDASSLVENLNNNWRTVQNLIPFRPSFHNQQAELIWRGPDAIQVISESRLLARFDDDNNVHSAVFDLIDGEFTLREVFRNEGQFTMAEWQSLIVKHGKPAHPITTYTTGLIRGGEIVNFEELTEVPENVFVERYWEVTSF